MEGQIEYLEKKIKIMNNKILRMQVTVDLMKRNLEKKKLLQESYCDSIPAESFYKLGQAIMSKTNEDYISSSDSDSEKNSYFFS